MSLLQQFEACLAIRSPKLTGLAIGPLPKGQARGPPASAIRQPVRASSSGHSEPSGCGQLPSIFQLPAHTRHVCFAWLLPSLNP